MSIDLNNTIKQIDLVEIYRTLYLTNAEYNFLKNKVEGFIPKLDDLKTYY